MSPSNRTAHAQTPQSGEEEIERTQQIQAPAVDIWPLHHPHTHRQHMYIHRCYIKCHVNLAVEPLRLNNLMICSALLFLFSFPTPDLSVSKICNEACVNKLAPSTFLMKHTLSSQHRVTSEPTAIIHTTAQFNLIQSLSCLVFHKSKCVTTDRKVPLATGFSQLEDSV